MNTVQTTGTGGLTIRRARDADRAALDRLAELDSAAAGSMRGDVLVAETEGRLLAAVSLSDGTTVADPFARTGELRSLLALRARQLGARGAGRSHFGRRHLGRINASRRALRA